RGPAATLPTAASQEDLATKACRGQPMYRPRPPAEWEAADGAAEAVRGALSAWRDTGILARRRQRAITEHFEAALSGGGSGPRRAHTRNLAPRWKACRLGVGAVFGDRPILASNEAAQQLSPGTEAPPPGHLSGPALETAITAEETELLEIGAASYRRHLAAGVRERLDRAVVVLRATGSMDGVPRPALNRICRYATERTAGPNLVDLAHPPLLNPPADGPVRAQTLQAQPGPVITDGRDQEDNDETDRNNNNDDDNNNNNRSSGNVMCRQGTFRGTVFFVVEGQGEVVLGDHGRTGCAHGQEGGGGGSGGGGDGGSSTESLLVASAFSNRRALQNRRKSRRRRGVNVHAHGDASNSGKGGGGGGASGRGENERESSNDGLQGNGTPAGFTAAVAATVTEGNEILPGSTIFSSRAGNNHAAAAFRTGAAPHRHGIGAEPDASASASSLASKIAKSTVNAAAAATCTPDDKCGVEVTSRRTGLITSIEPSAITAESSELPAPEFPGLHMASLVAGPGGLRCLTVGLAVLQKVCPPVHRRLAKTVAERYGGCVKERR
ncbi:unnamed protein product, partial [Hapterophycus canaliculatus]